MKAQKPKPWPCPNCGAELGTVVYGQLYINGEITANTDGSNLNITCRCGTIKTWYANDRLTVLIKELAKEIAERLNID